MSVLIITHALNNQFKDYEPFFEALKNNSLQWWHYFDTTWLVVTNLSAHAYANLLFPHMEDTDRLLVARLSREYEGWLPADAWQWINTKTFS